MSVKTSDSAPWGTGVGESILEEEARSASQELSSLFQEERDLSLRQAEEALSDRAKGERMRALLGTEGLVPSLFLERLSQKCVGELSSLKEGEDFCWDLFLLAWCRFFLIYTRLRRDRDIVLLYKLLFQGDRGDRSERDEDSELVSAFRKAFKKGYPEEGSSLRKGAESMLEHLRLMAKAQIYGPSRDLIRETGEIAHGFHQEGFSNHYGEVVADYYSIHLEETIVQEEEGEDKEPLRDKVGREAMRRLRPYGKRLAPEILDAASLMQDVLSSEDGKKYAKFHLTYGRLLALLGEGGKAGQEIREGIALLGRRPEGLSGLARYESYLREVSGVSSFYQTEFEILALKDAEEQLKNEKITNIAYVSIFSTLVGFVTATVSALSGTVGIDSLALLVTLLALSVSFLIALVLLFILVVNKKGVRRHKVSYAIVILALALSFIGFFLILSKVGIL